MKTGATVLLCLATLGFSKVAHAKEVLGYVNLQRAILEVDEGKRAKEALKKTFEKKQADLQKKEQELKSLKDALERDATKDDPQTRQKRIEFQNKLLDLQQVFVKEQQELQQLEQKELSAITAKMRKIIEDIGKTGGYTLILEIQDSRLLYAKAHLDLTNEVIRKYNSMHK
jgi:outer membrane protein